MSYRAVKAGLDVSTALLVIAAIGFWIIDSPIPRAQASPSPAVRSRATRVGTEAGRTAMPVADANAIVSGNIFSPTRAAPASRYTPSDGLRADVSEPPLEMIAPPVALPRVYGTMSGPNGATALIQLDSAGASGQLFREGERVGAFRIEKILGNSVIVRGPSGRVELRVEPQQDRNP